MSSHRVIILVTEYFKTKNLSTEEVDESYHRISEFLRKREEIETGLPVSDMFRNYAGIRMQSARIRCLDPAINLSGMQGTKLQKEIVAEFLENPESMYRDAKYFIDKGYQVTAFNGSGAMSKRASQYLGMQVDTVLIQKYTFHEQCDGI